MYRIIVSCWPEWWRTSLAKMINLVPQPMEIIVERFSDSELDLLLNAMKVTRSDFAHAVLELMRVPRLSSLVMTHRDKLRDSGDVTAERVVYEDWKDRLSRRGPKVGLTDEQMKAFVAELGKKLQLDLTQALTRGEVVRSLSEESGKAEMSLQIVVAELASGRWLQPGTKPNTLRVMKDRIPYVLAVALISNFGEELDVEILEAKIAEFLDPLKAHSLGASILRAATTIALIETEVSAACRKVLMSKWLEEQNFRAGDFDAFWRVIGIQPDLIFDLAEEWWLARRGRSFIDEAFIKAIANAASFPGFRTALQVRLATWLGTAWPDPKVGEFLGKVDTTSSEAKRRVKITRARYRQWTGSQSAGAFVNVQLDNSNRDWSWLSARELAILSYLDRAPFATAFEAWALSRSIMDRPRHESEMAWVVRLNLKDDREATNTLRDLIRRLERHDHPICTQAIKYLEAAMSHVQRAVEPPALKDSRRDDPVSAFQVPEMSYSDLVDATREYLRPYTWKKHEPETSAELINAFVTRGLDEDEAGIELILEHLRDLLTILTTDSRRRLHETICNKLSERSIDSTPEKQPNFGIQSSLLTLQLYDADPEEQSTLILNGQIGSEIDTWLPVLRPLTISDVGEPNFDDIADTDITGGLDYVDERLCRDDVNGLEFLPMFTAHNDAAVRKAALRLAIHGRHLGALEAFAQSPYSPPIPGDEKVDREHEYLRNCALLELHHFRPPQIVSDGLSSEAVALIAKHKPDNADALNNFHNYLRQQFAAIKYEKSWSAPRYWCSYGTTVEAVVESDLNAVLQWLRPWLEEPGNHLERALMDHFPVIDAMQALGNLAPKESIDLYKLLIERTRGGMFSSEGLKSFPFSVPASKEVDELCSQQLLEAINDKSLLEIVYFAHKHSRLDWLFEAIIELETSERPVDVAKAYTLLGFCDKGTRADTLWKCYLERPPTDAWLKCVLSCSVVNYRGNEDARQAFIEYWNSKSSAVSGHALKQVLDTSDLRILLWIGSIQPDWSDCPYDRRLLWSWVTAQLNDAIKKNRDARKKEFVHTRLAYSMMCPWKLTNVA